MKSIAGDIVTVHTKSGLRRYQVEVHHTGLNKYQVVKSDDPQIVQQKANAIMARWDEMWATRVRREQAMAASEKKQGQAETRTIQAQEHLAWLEQILSRTLDVHDAIDWETLKQHADYSVPLPVRAAIRPEPRPEDFPVNLGFLDRFSRARRQEREQIAVDHYKAAHDVWVNETLEAERKYVADIEEWEEARSRFRKERDAANAAIDQQREDYQSGTDTQAIVDYCDLVLSNSFYPDYFPQSYDLEYFPNTKSLIVEYQLPALSDLPTLKEVKYIKSRDDFSEKHISQSQLNNIYDSLVYQITLRTVHELFEADQIKAIDSIVFNGFVDATDPATGQSRDTCIVSLLASREEFLRISLANVDPKACFRSLKGVSAARLHQVTPVPPIITIDRDDKRFTSTYDVSDQLEGENLAAMDWEDFEHLIRELFEKEFSGDGSEVKVTRASRDGGIDAVAFDADPIRGGKIVIQAKRYTNTVGVSAVRDLYGTVINEGANKGILVSTADFGPDAYDFCKGKPITLLGGAQLLHLLEKHGTKARIDLREAKQTLAGKS